MTSDSGFAGSLVAHFERIHEQFMQGLPILNPRLTIEAVGVREFGEQKVCVLITPWFMNLVVWSATGRWDREQEGELISISLPREALEFTVCRDAEIGSYLSAVLFRTMTDFPDQRTAKEIALETVHQLFTDAKPTESKVFKRRALFTGLDAS
jgi:[NiFe] hydrogenase assembly HybE family chaperone